VTCDINVKGNRLPMLIQHDKMRIYPGWSYTIELEKFPWDKANEAESKLLARFKAN